MTFKYATCTMLLGCSSLALATAAHAQSPAPEMGIEDIVVTAQRTEQNIQSVPVAVTAFSAAALEKRNITNVEDLHFSTPNMQIRSDAAFGGLSIGIRGINVVSENFSFDSAVGVYVNDVFVARSNDFGASFFDVESVQVLRGPQGTLFGRNTPAGAVLIKTQGPSDTLGGYVKAGLGGGGHGLGNGADRTIYRVEGAIDVPLSSILAVRLAGYYENDTGWGRSRFTGHKFFSKDDGAVRATVDFKPSSDFDARLVFGHSRVKQGGYTNVPLEFLAPFTAHSFDQRNGGTLARDALIALAQNPKPFENDSAFTGGLTGRVSTASLDMTYRFSDDWSLRSISGWRHVKRDSLNDVYGIQFMNDPRGTSGNLRQEQLSQELVLAGDLTDQLHLVSGLFYFQETGSDQNILYNNVRNPSTPAAFIDPLLLRGEAIKNVSKAAFVNLAYDILPNLTVSGGYRFTRENKRVTLAGRFLNTGLPFTSGTEKFKDNVSVYDAKLTWEATPDLLIYGKYGTGYRAGGIGFRAADSQFQPEKVETYEAGAKWDFDIGIMPARLNTAVFRSKYQNFQVTVNLTNPVRTTVINAGGAILKGTELEFSVKPTSGLDLAASLGLLDAHYTSFTFTNASLGGVVNLTNNELRLAPELNLQLSASYTVPSNIGEWLFHVNYAHSASFENDAVYQAGAPPVARTNAFRQGPSDIVNARIRLGKAFGSNVDVSLWAQNLTDKKILAYSINVGTFRSGTFNEPRSYGIELRANF